jgi:hypothetical protein
MKVRRLDLVRPDDPGYLAAMSEAAQAHRRLGPRQDPGHIYRASGGVETAVRDWLAERVSLLPERVIDVDLLLDGRRAYERRYIELDAVEGTDGLPRRVFEAKFSSSPGAIRRGLAQLGRARALLGRRWDAVASLLVLVEANRSGVEIDRERFQYLRLIGPDEVAGDPGSDTPLLVLALADLTRYLSADDLTAIERGRDEGDELTDRRRERAAADDDEGGAGDRRAGWPEPLPRPVEPAASLTFGGTDEADESPFAALRGLAAPLDDRD